MRFALKQMKWREITGKVCESKQALRYISFQSLYIEYEGCEINTNLLLWYIKRILSQVRL